MLEGVHELDGSLADIDHGGLSGLLGNSLGEHLLALLLGFPLEGVVLADSSLEGFTALRAADVLNSDVNSLGDDSASVLLVNDDTDGVLGNVEDATGLSVVELVRHALVDGAVSDNVNEVTLFVSLHDLREMDGPVLSESLGKQVSCSSSLSVCVRHLYFLIVK